MFRYLIDIEARRDLVHAQMAYVSYFSALEDPSKGELWATRFFDEYQEKIEILKENPFFYGRCRVYPFDTCDTEYRTFTAGWFTVFYTVGNTSFTVWHVASSKSDFTKI